MEWWREFTEKGTSLCLFLVYPWKNIGFLMFFYGFGVMFIFLHILVENAIYPWKKWVF